MSLQESIRRVRFLLRSAIGRRRLERDMDAELAHHIEMETAANIRAGLPPEEAARRARIAFGGGQRFREEARDELRTRAVEDAAQDLKFASRSFRRTPAFTATVVLTLAVGIGATTVVFSVADNVVLRALPYANADRLATVEILTDRLKNITPTWTPNAAHYLAWKSACTVCGGMAAVRPIGYTLTGAGDPTVLSGFRVSDDFFSMLGARAEVGRLFAAGDDAPGNQHTVVISDALWRRQFGARTDIVGRAITMGDVPWTVVGVLSPSFHMLSGKQLGAFLALPERADIYVPLALTPRERATPGEHSYGVIALLKPGASPPSLAKQLDAISANNATALHDNPPAKTLVEPLQTQVAGAAARPLLLLLGAVVAMLLIMCVNLANLFLARSASRRRESAVRVALGAGRGRLVRQALTETLLLAGIGGVVGIIASRWGVQAVVALAPADLPRLDQVHVDARVLGVAIVLSLIAGLAFGLAPALRVGGTSPGDVLKESSRGATAGRRSAAARAWLIASQVALSAMLLTATGLFLRSFARVLHADRGFTAERVVALNITLPGKTYATAAARGAFYDELLRRAGALPGVVSVAVSNGLPLEGEQWVESVWTESAGGRDKEYDTNFRFVSPSYFSVLGIPLLAGRAFTEADRGARRVVLSQNAARSLWRNENPIGKWVHLGGTDTSYEVIGIVPNVRTTGIEKEGSLSTYTPYWEKGYAPTLIVRTAAEPSSVVSALRETVRSLAPTAPISRVRTIGDVISTVVAARRFEVVLIGLFALTALLTASIGIYGIISHSLGQRANEVSIRMALGAAPHQLVGLVAREMMQPVLLGLAAGVGGSLLVGRAMSSLLFEVRPSDPATLAVVSIVLGAVAVLACWAPARRAMHADPADALRAG